MNYRELEVSNTMFQTKTFYKLFFNKNTNMTPEPDPLDEIRKQVNKWGWSDSIRPWSKSDKNLLSAVTTLLRLIDERDAWVAELEEDA